MFSSMQFCALYSTFSGTWPTDSLASASGTDWDTEKGRFYRHDCVILLIRKAPSATVIYKGYPDELSD